MRAVNDDTVNALQMREKQHHDTDLNEGLQHELELG